MQSTQATNQLNPTGVGTRRCARVRLVRGTDTDGPQAPCCCRLQVIGFEISFRARNLSESNIGGRLDPEVADSDVYSLIVSSASTRAFLVNRPPKSDRTRTGLTAGYPCSFIGHRPSSHPPTLYLGGHVCTVRAESRVFALPE